MTFPQGVALAEWLVTVGSGAPLGQLIITDGKNTVNRPTDSISQRWVYSSSPVSTQNFSFNTPIGVAEDKQCGRVVFSDSGLATQMLNSVRGERVGARNGAAKTVTLGGPRDGNLAREKFLSGVRTALALRAGYVCSFEGCEQLTVGPSDASDMAYSSVGVAAHISAASSGGAPIRREHAVRRKKEHQERNMAMREPRHSN